MQNGSNTAEQYNTMDATAPLRSGAYEGSTRQSLPHVTDRFIPISHIIAALARTSYTDLRSLRSTLIDASDQKRKKKMVDYAARYRTELVKVLVLVIWAARAEEVSMAIDLRAWLQGQKNCFENLYSLLRFDISRSMSSAKVISPNIETAAELLTTGGVSQLKNTSLSKQFQVVKSLSQTDIVHTLRTVNALLSLRLSLYEVLPSAFHDWTVQSGRATFHVDNEFFVDLFFASEEVTDPNLQWFLIDFRFAYTQEDRLETPLSLRLEIEAVANNLLASPRLAASGKHQLVELYNLLHSFTIQYKLERLFSQFSTLGTREKGRIDVKYSSVQKVLAVGFWLHKRSKDRTSVLNSLTITIKAPATSSSDNFLASDRVSSDYNREQLQLIVREGDKELATDAISIEQHNAKSLLHAVVHFRIHALLHRIHTYLTEFAPSLELSTLDSSHLQISLSQNDCLRITMSDYNGDYLVSRSVGGSTFAHTRPRLETEQLQFRLNRLSDSKDLANCIYDFKLQHTKQEIERAARLADWVVVPFNSASVHQEQFATSFGEARLSLQSCIFLSRPQEGWQNVLSQVSWFVVVESQTVTTRLWLAEMTSDNVHAKWDIQWVEPIHLKKASDDITNQKFNADVFKNVERFCTARVVGLQISRALVERGIKHYLGKSETHSAWFTPPSIMFPTRYITRHSPPWTESVVSVKISTATGEASSRAVVMFTCHKLPDQSFDLSQFEDIEFQAEASSLRFSFVFKAAVSQDAEILLSQFCRKWRLVENTIGIVKSAQQADDPYVLDMISLNTVRFLYCKKTFVLQIEQQPSLVDDSVQLMVTLGSTGLSVNPHNRVSSFLSVLANRYQEDMALFFRSLNVTLPVLSTLQQIEQKTCENPSFYIMARSFATYRIYYPEKSVTLLLRARPAPEADTLPQPFKKIANSTVWHFTDGSRSSLPVASSVVIDSCEEIFRRGLNDVLQTDMTFPERSGIACSLQMASRVLIEVHNTILRRQPDSQSQQVIQQSINGTKPHNKRDTVEDMSFAKDLSRTATPNATDTYKHRVDGKNRLGRRHPQANNNTNHSRNTEVIEIS